MTDASNAWECFSDPSYFDLWCVRRIGQRGFGEGFHLVNGDEARSLTALLNASAIEAASADETPQAAQPSGESAAPNGGDAHV